MSTQRRSVLKRMPRSVPASFLALATTTLLGGCTESASEEASLSHQDPRSGIAGHLVIPDSERVEVQTPTPIPLGDFEVDSPRFSLVDLPPDDVWLCTFELQVHGLPAVRRDGTALAFVVGEPPGGSDGPLSSTFIIEGVTEQPSRDARPLEEGDSDDEDDESDGCRSYRARLAERVEAYNVELEAYRPLTRLDILGDWPKWDPDSDPTELVPPTALPVARRPVQALYRKGWFVIRIPGVRVLTRQAKTHWRHTDEYCLTNPNINGIWGDATTGLGMVSVDHIGGACLCDNGQYMHPITLPADVFEESNARPTDAYTEQIERAFDSAWEPLGAP